jgi:hypothetical protein
MVSKLISTLLSSNAQFCPKFYPAGILTHIHHIRQTSQNHRYTQVSEPIPLILVVKRGLLYYQPSKT